MNSLKKQVNKLHRKYSHHSRVDILSDLIANLIEKIFIKNDLFKLNFLDIGCGDMLLSNKIGLKVNSFDIDLYGIDVYDSFQKYDAHTFENYVRFDGKNIPFKDKQFHVSLFCDVLHHDFNNLSYLLNEAKRVSDYIIIKDHFEYGIFSRKILQLMDFIGNWGYDVDIPKRYFTQKSFFNVIEELNLLEIQRIGNIKLYNHLPIMREIAKEKMQFISVLKCENETE